MKKLLVTFFAICFSISSVKAQNLEYNGLTVSQNGTYFTLKVPVAYDEGWAQYDDFMDYMNLSYNNQVFFRFCSNWYASQNASVDESDYVAETTSIYDPSGNMNPAGRVFFYRPESGVATFGNNYHNNKVVITDVDIYQEGSWFYVELSIILPLSMNGGGVSFQMNGGWYSYYDDGGAFDYQSLDFSEHSVSDSENNYVNSINWQYDVYESFRGVSDYWHILEWDTEHTDYQYYVDRQPHQFNWSVVDIEDSGINLSSALAHNPDFSESTYIGDQVESFRVLSGPARQRRLALIYAAITKDEENIGYNRCIGGEPSYSSNYYPTTTTSAPFSPSVNAASSNQEYVEISWNTHTHIPDDLAYYRVLRQEQLTDGTMSDWEIYHEQGINSHSTDGTSVVDGTANIDLADLDGYEHQYTRLQDPNVFPGRMYKYRVYTLASAQDFTYLDDDVLSEEYAEFSVTKTDLPIAEGDVNVDNKSDNCTKMEISWNQATISNSNYSSSLKYKIVEFKNGEYIREQIRNEGNVLFDVSDYLESDVLVYRIYTYAENLLKQRWESSFAYREVETHKIETAATVQNFTANYEDENEGVVLRWDKLSTSEHVDRFSIYRDNVIISEDILNSNVEIDPFNQNKQRFIDQANLVDCETYTYKVESKVCNSSVLSDEVSTLVSADLNGTFNSEKNLEVSKGYYSDRVKLTWDNNNNEIITKFIVNRRIYSANNDHDWIEIDQLANTVHSYMDNFAEAGVLYEYQILAEIPCGENASRQSSYIDIGFRIPEASASGHIEYEGGNNVPNVKVRAESTSPGVNYSLELNGANYVDISNLSSIIAENNYQHFTFTTWFKMNGHTGTLLSIDTEESVNLNTDEFNISIDSDGAEKYIHCEYKNVNTSTYSNYYPENISFEEWNHLSVVYNDSINTLSLYLNGVMMGDEPLDANIEVQAQGYFSIGQNWINGSNAEFYNGLFDEVRLWERALGTEEVMTNYDRYISKSDLGLIAMYHCDEGLGNKVYDISKNSSGAYNKNHGDFINGKFSNTIPSVNQLSNYALTDENGNYIIEGIRYTESGSNFTLSPLTTAPYYQSVHEFEPSQRVVFLGDGNMSSDGQNFNDISVFTVTGTVYYHDLHDRDEDGIIEEAGNCPVEDVMILIDGEPVIKNGDLIMTNAQGAFEIEVPIGEHRISVQKQGHTFTTGFYPSEDGFINFQEDIHGVAFIDNTIIEVKGRVVGGLLEGDKKLGMGLSENNIGVAEFRFDSQNGLDDLGIITDSESGEYQAQLLPIKYIISGFDVASNSAIAQYSDFQSFDVIDLSVIPQLTTIYDTTFAADHTVSEIDSVSYHYDRSFVYRSVPSIRVLNSEKTALFTAEQSIEIDEDITFESLEELGHPIFKQNRPYETYIKVEEEYKNYDVDQSNPVINRIPVQNGQLTIVNNLSTDPTEQSWLLDSEDGDTLYRFRAGLPNLQTDQANSDYSFTKTWNITFETGPHVVSWQPNGKIYRGIVFGAKSEGTNFVTQGPQVVSHILRDPPGSASFAFYEEGASLSQSTSISTSMGSSFGMSSEVSVGPKFTVGLGYATEVEIEASVSSDVEISSSIGYDGEYIETMSFKNSFSTNADDEYEGMWMDVYMGRSMNMNFGMSTVLTLVDTATCNTAPSSAIECLGDEVNGYRIGRQKGFFVVPGGYGTEFYYTQHEIVNALIPELEYLRNNMLLTDSRYSNISDVNYGLNNDDSIWAEQGVENKLKVIENTGPSYTFNSSADTAQVDSVRWFNQQIRLWEGAVAENERLKLEASPVANGSTNISFDGGVGDITYSYENSNSNSNAITWESSINNEWSAMVGGSVGGIGATMGMSMEVSLERSGSHTMSEENTTTVGFTLSDGGLDDKYSIDILDDGTAGNGKVFRVQGGRTSCPYFDGEKTLYYQPGTELSAATIQMEQPTLAVSPSSLSNVPENELAVFNLSLGNDNPLGYIQEYSLQVVEQHNPNGAIIKIDGINPNREYLVPAGTSINKVLTVEKGPEALDYENIMLVFHSSCQYDPTNNNDNISDTILLSVSFLAGCTGVEILDPDPNWVVNSDNQEDGQTTMDVLISDYNYNYYSLDNIKLQYKNSTSSDWLNVETFHKYAEGSEQSLPDDQSFVSQAWDLTDLPDGDYDLRAITDCDLATEQTNIYSGHMDRIRPHNFGTPSPADGILDPNDEIQINFNENINEAILGYPNFSISGVLNGSEIRHDVSLYFDGADALTIPTGINLQNKSFTVEMWVKHQGAVSQTLFTQGYEDGNQMRIELTENSQIALSLLGATVTSMSTVPQNEWTHIAVIYNQDIGQVDFLINGNLQETQDGGLELLADYNGEGPITVGESFIGNIHELRVWKSQKNSGDIYAEMLMSQSGKEANLLGLWPMDELEGNPQDKARSRHATTTAEWQVSPGGLAYTFDSANQEYLSADMSDLSFRKDQDFTLELWFKADGTNQTILSNGTVIPSPSNPEVLFGNYEGWTIKTNDSGKIEVSSNLHTLTSISTYADNNWHHLALVKSANATTTLYVNGTEQASRASSDFRGFGGTELVIGATPESDSQNTSYTNYLNGSVDDIRLWNKARKQNQIIRDARTKLQGDERGLVAYYPFEMYSLNEANMYETVAILADQHLVTEAFVAHDLEGSGSYNSNDKPLVRMARQVEAVNFSYSSNGDRVILDITDELSKVEGCILDIEVDGVYDMYGNVMSSPITWTAYINQNQLIWDEQEIQKDKTLGEPLAFTTNIVNQGGLVESFQIANLPAWLTASPSEGLLQPNSYEQITFVVNDNLFIGDYTEDITLTGNNNYPERLELNILVEAVQPSYELNPSDFEYTMNFVGQIKVDDIVSRDDKDILFAYVNNELRGAASPIYIADLDKYYVFMDVYSNDNGNGETLEFRLWDASEGKTHAQVSPENSLFTMNTVVGTADSPQLFVASNKLRQEIPLSEGWNWLSFNLDAEDDTIASGLLIPTVMEAVNSSQVISVKGQTSFSQYASAIDTWLGSLTSLDMGDMYMVKMNASDTIVYQGATLDLNEHPKAINQGWNWVGYLGQRSMGLAEGLSSLNPSPNDLIKSQEAFSIYFNESIGWIGSLNSLNVGEGYMLKSATAQTLIYPESSLYGGSSFRLDKNQYPASIWQVQPERYEHSMNIIAQIDHSDYYHPSAENVLGAFSGDLCLGNIKATAINEHESIYFLTVYGDTEALLSFNYFDADKEQLYRSTSSLDFEANSVIGTVVNPFPIQIDVESAVAESNIFNIALYPNPFADYLELSYRLVEPGAMHINIYDVMGRHMRAVMEAVYQEKGSYKRQLDVSELSQGVYFIEFKLGGKLFKKMIIKS